MSDDFHDLKQRRPKWKPSVIVGRYDDLKRRLYNWGRWRWRDLMCGAPDGSCQNPMYEFMVSGDDDGHADERDKPQRRVVEEITNGEQEPINEADAESMHFWVMQSGKNHVAVLVRRFVMRQRVTNEEFWGAIYAVEDRMEANRAVNAEMARRMR